MDIPTLLEILFFAVVAYCIFIGLLNAAIWVLDVVIECQQPARDSLPAETARLTAVADYTQAVTLVRANATLSAHERLARLGETYEQNLARLANAGHLTRDVEAAFRDFAEASATAVTGLTADFGDSLRVLVKTYDGRYRRRLR